MPIAIATRHANLGAWLAALGLTSNVILVLHAGALHLSSTTPPASPSRSNRSPAGLADTGERLGEIRDDVVDVLNADGGADRGIRDAKAFSGLSRHA